MYFKLKISPCEPFFKKKDLKFGKTPDQIKKQHCVTEVWTDKEYDCERLNDLLNRLQPGDELVVTRLDRFGRRTVEALSLITELQNRGVSFKSLDMPFIDDPKIAQLFQILYLFFAELENSIRAERVSEGIKMGLLNS